MTDMENVIKGLWCCNHAGNCSTCPFDIKGGTDRDEKGRTCLQNLIAAAYDALKAQEPVKPVIDIDTRKCGNCGHTLEHQELLGDNVLFHEQYDYCPICGRAVKWK